MKPKDLLITLLITLMAISCKKPTVKSGDLQNDKIEIDTTAFNVQVTDSIIKINGQHLKMGDSVSNWVKVLGKYNRRFEGGIDKIYIWDSLGIKLHTYHDGHELSSVLIRRFNICFLGLESPEAKTGKMRGLEDYDFSDKYKDSLTVVSRYINRHNKKENMEEVIKGANEFWAYIRDKQDYRNYRYPLKNFSGNLYINGFKTNLNEDLKTLNQKRHNKGHDMFSYYDDTSYGFGPTSSNKTGETEETYNIGDYSAIPKKTSLNHPIYFKIRFFENKIYEAEIDLIPQSLLETSN